MLEVQQGECQQSGAAGTTSEDGRLSVNSNEESAAAAKGKGRILYCRKCEGHGVKVILKNHSPTCPYILCTCKSCEKLNFKRLKSFNKRNKEKLELAAALNAQRKAQVDSATAVGGSDDEESRRSSFSSNGSPASTMDNTENKPCSRSTGLESRSMSLGSMTVMSYDIWRARCAAEKKRLEEEGKQTGEIVKSPGEHPTLRKYAKDPSALPHDLLRDNCRKRAHSTTTQEEIPKLSPKDGDEKKGRYILLPTIPAMKIFIKDEDEVVVGANIQSIKQEQPDCNTLASTSCLPSSSNIPIATTAVLPSPPNSATFLSATPPASITLPTVYTYQPSPSHLPVQPSLDPTAFTQLVTSSGHTDSQSLIKPVPLSAPFVPSTDHQSTLFRSLLPTQQSASVLLPPGLSLQPVHSAPQSADASVLSSLLTSQLQPQTALTSAADVVQLLRAQQQAQQQLAAVLQQLRAPTTITAPAPIMTTIPSQYGQTAPTLQSMGLPNIALPTTPHSQLTVPVSSPTFVLPPSTTSDLIQSLLNHSRQQPIISHGI